MTNPACVRCKFAEERHYDGAQCPHPSLANTWVTDSVFTPPEPSVAVPPAPTVPEKYPEQKHCCTVCAQRRQCSICDDQTALACSDCAIDLHATVYVCKKSSCRNAHEAKCPHELRGCLGRAEATIAALVEAANEFRDNVLNQRGRFEEGTLDNYQANTVLNGFDDTIGTAVVHARATGKE